MSKPISKTGFPEDEVPEHISYGPYMPPHKPANHHKSIFERTAEEVGKLVTEKNAAYGDSFAQCGKFLRLLFPNGIHPDQYDDALALVRIFDKQMRIATRKDAFGESPYRDIAGYGLLGVVKDERK